MLNRENHRPTVWYRQPLVWLLVLIPSSAVVMGVLLISLAVLSNDGLVVDDYYRHGLEINRQLARDEAAVAYALAATLQLDPHTETASVRLRWGNGFSPPNTLQCNLYHTTRSGLDTQVDLQPLTPHHYTGKLPRLAPGRYHVHLEADDWRLTGSLLTPVDSQVELAAGPSS
ncbi:MAG: FixH family protein [Gammaproteobacteria bacterium]